MQLRIATPDDASLVEDVLRASYPALMGPCYPPELLAHALPLMMRANPSLLASGRYFIVTGEGLALACGGWSEDPPGGVVAQPGRAHIRHFAVRADRIGGGIGRAIFDRCEREAAAVGFATFECRSSLNGEPFYAALGFRRVRAIEEPMGPGLALPAVLMECAIRPPS